MAIDGLFQHCNKVAERGKCCPKTISGLANRPEKVEMEFGASLTGECDLWIISGTAKAEFKVALTWGKGQPHYTVEL